MAKNAAWEALKKEKQSILTKLKEQAQDVFNETAKEIFEKHPKLHAFGWTQYTPYFNDGDTCEFGVNKDVHICFNGKEFEDVSNWTFESENKWAKEAKAEQGLKEAAADISELMEALDDEDFKQMFGDHMEVTVTKEGAKTEEYEHE